jgi:hypothetical protein
VKDKVVAWERPLRKSDLAALGDDAPDGAILAVHVPLPVKDALLLSEPDVFFTTPHFNGYPAILVRLDVIAGPELKALLHEAWLERAPPKVLAARAAVRKPAAKNRPTRKTAAAVKRPAAKKPAVKKAAAKKKARA